MCGSSDLSYRAAAKAAPAPAPAPALTRTAAALKLAEVMAKDSWQAVQTTYAEPLQYSGDILYPHGGAHNQAVVDALDAFRKAASDAPDAPGARPGTAEAFALAEKLAEWSDYDGDLMNGPEGYYRDYLFDSDGEYVGAFSSEIRAFRAAVEG